MLECLSPRHWSISGSLCSLQAGAGRESLVLTHFQNQQLRPGGQLPIETCTRLQPHGSAEIFDPFQVFLAKAAELGMAGLQQSAREEEQ